MPNISASKFAVAIIVAMTSLSPVSAQGPIDDPPGPEISFRGCRYYWHADFEGPREDIAEGVSRRSVGVHWNDQISSVACHADCSMIAYEHDGYDGAQLPIAGTIAAVAPEWNDRISSMTVSCTTAEEPKPAPDAGAAPEPKPEPEPEQQADMEPSR